MSPKVEAPQLPADLPALIALLKAGTAPENADRLLPSLALLLNWTPAQLPQDADSAAALLGALRPYLGRCDTPSCTAAIKALARLAGLQGPLRRAALTQEVVKDAWAILCDMAATWPEYQAQLAVKTADAVPDWDTTLPGPSKQALDAALRLLTEAALADAAASLGWLAEMGGPPTPVVLGPLTILLDHHSPRIQLRAAHLVALLAGVGALRPSLAVSGAVPGLLRLATDSQFGSVRLAGLQALLALVRDPATAASTQLLAADASPRLLQLLVLVSQDEAGQGANGNAAAPPAPPARAPAGKQPAADIVAPASSGLDYTKPSVARQVDVQTATLQLLDAACHVNQAFTKHLALAGTLRVLMAMLPGWPRPEASASPPLAGPIELPPTETRDEPAAWDRCADPSLAPAGLLPLPSAAAQTLALQVVAQLLTVPELAVALQQRLVAGAPAPEVSAADSDGVAPAGPPLPHPVQQLISLFGCLPSVSAAPASVPATATAAVGKGGKPAKGKAEEPPVAPTGVPSHLVPPFPAAVRGAALEALAAYARHPGPGAWLARDPGVQAIVRMEGRTPSRASPVGSGKKREARLDSTVREPELAAPLALLLLRLQASSAADVQLEQRAEVAKRLAAAALDTAAGFLVQNAIAAAVLSMPDELFVAPPRPPLPSPPSTPPPLPLATSLFLWDALDRPVMGDGTVRLATA